MPVAAISLSAPSDAIVQSIEERAPDLFIASPTLILVNWQESFVDLRQRVAEADPNVTVIVVLVKGVYPNPRTFGLSVWLSAREKLL